MSNATREDLQCPPGNRQEVMVYESLNVSIDPVLKEKLFHGEINIFSCKQCGKNAFINAPLLYHDMKQKFCVQYYPPDVLKEVDFFQRFNPDGTPMIPRLTGKLKNFSDYLMKPYIVFDMNEMVHYVTFRERIAESKKNN